MNTYFPYCQPWLTSPRVIISLKVVPLLSPAVLLLRQLSLGTCCCDGWRYYTKNGKRGEMHLFILLNICAFCKGLLLQTSAAQWRAKEHHLVDQEGSGSYSNIVYRIKINVFSVKEFTKTTLIFIISVTSYVWSTAPTTSRNTPVGSETNAEAS